MNKKTYQKYTKAGQVSIIFSILIVGCYTLEVFFFLVLLVLKTVDSFSCLFVSPQKHLYDIA